MSAFSGLIESSPVTAFIISGLFEFFDITAGILLSFIIVRERPKRRIYPYIIVAAFCIINAVLYKLDFFLKDDFGYIAVIAAPLIVFPLSKNKSYKYCIISFMTDIVLGILSSLAIAASGENYDTIAPSSKLGAEFIVSAVTALLIFVAAVFSARKGNSESLIARIRLPGLLLVVLTVMIFSMTMIHFQINFSTKPTDLLLSFLNIALLGVTVFYIVRDFLKSRLSEEKYKTQLELQIKHLEILEEKNREIRVFRHDMPKKLRPLAMYIEEGNYDEAKSILDGFDVSIENSRSGFDTGNFMLDTVLESEQQLAGKKGINIILVHGSTFPKDGIASQDIYTIFPNAIDNAIEATEKVHGESKEIKFESHVNQGKVYIKISNPCAGEVRSRNNTIMTTKKDKDNHGYGLLSIKKAAAKYGSNNVKFSSENNVFTLSIALKYSE